MKENFKKADYPLRFINTVINELWVKIIKMKVLKFHPIYLELQNLSYLLKSLTVNSVNLNPNIF